MPHNYEPEPDWAGLLICFKTRCLLLPQQTAVEQLGAGKGTVKHHHSADRQYSQKSAQCWNIISWRKKKKYVILSSLLSKSYDRYFPAHCSWTGQAQYCSFQVLSEAWMKCFESISRWYCNINRIPSEYRTRIADANTDRRYSYKFAKSELNLLMLFIYTFTLF